MRAAARDRRFTDMPRGQPTWRTTCRDRCLGCRLAVRGPAWAAPTWLGPTDLSPAGAYDVCERGR
jgi:hypothetical protein